MKVLFINLDKLEYKIINIDSQGIISLGVKIHNEYESWKKIFMILQFHLYSV
jgi:hypothetical protein